MMKYLCLYADTARKRVGHLVEPKLATFTERHKIRLHLPTLHETKDPLSEMKESDAQGILIGLSRGWPDFATLQLARNVLRRRRKVWFHWPDELAVECIDEERLRSYCLHWFVISTYQYLLASVTRQLAVRWLRPTTSYAMPASVGIANGPSSDRRFDRIETDDIYKDEIQKQWNENPCGSHYAKESAPHTLQWFHEVEAYRYKEYAPWMPRTMEFSKHSGEQVLEVGGGLGTDLCQFALNGADVTDLDLSAGHLALAKENFELRGLKGSFIHHDAEDLPFEENTFDVVYSNGVLHHTPNTVRLVQEIWRVLKPRGRAIVMVYAQNSWHYWVLLVFRLGLLNGMLERHSMGEIMSRHVEMTETGSSPLIKVYTKRRLRRLFEKFENIEIVKTQLTASEFPPILRWIPLGLAGRFMGWNLVIKATKTHSVEPVGSGFRA